MRRALAICVFLTLGVPFSRAVDLSRGEDRLGVPAPRLGLERWLNSPPLEMDALRGKVVLIRWWTDGCPYCVATAPALQHLEAKYGARGLRVIGIFHPKPAGDWNVERMRVATQQKGFTFPVALDANWAALNRWWPDLEKRGWTSVSFVIDTKGIIRYVHPGGEFHQASEADHARCDRDYKDVEQTIERLLRE
jgi:peroxiredoxin